MKKHFILAAIMMAGMMMVSCNNSGNGNEPDPSGKVSFPELALSLKDAKVETAKQELKNRGYIEYEVDNHDEENATVYRYAYPATFFDDLNEILTKEWILFGFMDYNNSGKVRAISGEQHFLSAYSAFNTYKEWMGILEKLIAKPSTRIVDVMDSNHNLLVRYREGTLFEKYKALKLKEIEEQYAQGTLSKEEYEKKKAGLNVTKADLDATIATLSVLKGEFSIDEYYTELTDESTYKGIGTLSFFDNREFTFTMPDITKTPIPENSVVTFAVTNSEGEEIKQYVDICLSEVE